MANQRPKALFLIFLLFSAHAYRLEQASVSTLNVNGTALDSQAPGSYQAMMANRYATMNTFNAQFCGMCSCTSQYSQSFVKPTIAQTGQGLVTSNPVNQATTHVLQDMVSPKNQHFPDPGIIEILQPYWPLLLATGVVMMGGLYLYHQHRMNGPVAANFCPVSSWESDPVGMLVGPAAHDAFGERFSSLLTEDNNRGMPQCHGLRRHRLAADCDGDVDCKRQECRQMCCDRRECTFYQFNTIDSTDYCWLGSRSRLSTSTCEPPFFGETCTTCRDRQGELWPQIHEDNMKCHSALLGFTGFHVENQYECQAHAVEQGHEYYQYDPIKSKCETEATCDNPSRNTVHQWQIFHRDSSAPVQAAVARPPADQEVWQFEPFLLHENRGMTTVQLSQSERCTAGDETCMRDACRAQCLQHDWCIHYQFESSGVTCELGATHVIDEDDVGMWFGGILTQNRLCAADEYKCPSSHNCVSVCGGECDGHSREGPDGWCVRSAVENIVDDDGWTDNYNQHSIEAWCRGVERSVVTVSQGLGDGLTGADICRAACSADPECVLWQMYQSDADKNDLSEGDHVRCWLGMEDQLGHPRFSCTGRSPKRWRLLSAPRAEVVEKRGCHNGKVACVFSQQCVDLCADECPGFEITDVAVGICQPPSQPAMMSAGARMDMVLPGSLPQTVINPENSMLLQEHDLMTVTLNQHTLINPDSFRGDTTAICDVIPGAECDFIDGACVCEFDGDVDCAMLFDHTDRVVPVLAQEGMMMLSHEGCSCDGRRCTLSLLNSVPPVRTSPEATVAVQLRNNEAPVCEASTVCPNMGSCHPISYGAMGCGYSCENENGRHWCSDRCACNLEEAVTECTANTMCPNMHSCNPISYGEYGCGYGCMRDSTYYFCNDACTVCNV